jgi:preprotein translocase subunit YajC
MSLHLAVILLQGQGGAGIISLLPFLLLIPLFYFMIIVPQRRQRQQHEAMLNALKVGDKIVTTGGIYGTVTIIREDKRTVQLRIAESPPVKIDIARSAIAGLQETTEEKK